MDERVVRDFWAAAGEAERERESIEDAIDRDETFYLGEEWGERRKKWLEKQKAKERNV